MSSAADVRVRASSSRRSTITVAGWAIGAAYRVGNLLELGGLLDDPEDRRLFRIVDIPVDRCALEVERVGILHAWWVRLWLHVSIELRHAWLQWKWEWQTIARPQDEHPWTGKPLWWAEPWT